MDNLVDIVIAHAIDKLNGLRPGSDPLPKENTTVLVGENGQLNSMGYVNLLVALDETLDSELGINVFLADEIIADEISTVGDLRNVLTRIINGHNGGSPSAKGG